MGEEPPELPAKPPGAVFLSYASQDAGAAQGICAALRSAGIEVWFDQNELRGGDVWDQKIRQQIHDCALFIPIISANTASRREGYFRLEWGLAEQRAAMIARNMPFIMPVCVDSTPETSEDVPESFLRVQWTRLPGGAKDASFSERVAALLAGTGKPAYAPQKPVSPAMEPKRFGRWIAVGSVGTLLVGAIAWQSWRLMMPTPGAMSAAVRATQRAIEAVADKSIAVLPFLDLSEKHDQEYFAYGIAEETLNQLARIPGLKLIGRTSSFQFNEKADDLRKIGTTLRAAYVLEGSVRKSADRVRITAQLVSTADGSHLWSDTYDAKLDDVLKVQDELAASLARALEVTVNASSTADAVKTNPEAYDLYLRGLRALDKTSLEGCEQAIELLNEALRLEAISTRYLVALAWAHDCIGWQGWLVPDAGFGQARRFARRALEVDPTSAEAHLVLADAAIVHDWDWAAANREINAAFELSPPTARALHLAAGLAITQGQTERATELLHQALARDPLNPRTYDRLCGVYYRAGRYVEAEAMCRRVLQIAPQFGGGHYWLAVAILMQGRLQDALAETERAAPGEGQQLGSSVVLYAMHRRAESNVALKKAIEVNSSDWPSGIARAYAFRGERDQAMAWLERAYKARDVDMFFIKGDPQLRSLENDPRYKALLRKMNLPE